MLRANVNSARKTVAKTAFRSSMNTATDVILFSGGLDSLVTLGIALQKTPNPRLFFCDIGANASDQERKAAKRIAKYYGLHLEVVKVRVPFIQTSLLGSSERFIVYTADSKKDTESETGSFIIGYRNFALISLALMYCSSVKASTLWCGFDYEEKGGSSKDKSPRFITAFQRAIETGGEHYEQVRIETPLQLLAKHQIITKGVRCSVPFHLSWTCYNELSKPCGVCNACIDRRQGFKKLSLTDPVEYASDRMLLRVLSEKDIAEIRQDQKGLV